MGKRKVDFDVVRDIGLALPGVEESSVYGSGALKLHGTLMAAIAVNRSAEPGSLFLRINNTDRDELIAAAPDIYYVTDHYEPYNGVLVRLSRVTPDVLHDLLGMAHKFVSRKVSPKRKRSSTRV